MVTDNEEVLGTYAIIIMNVRIKVIDCEVRTVFIWVKTGTSGGPLSLRKRPFASIR
jgi:hypothetical protein